MKSLELWSSIADPYRLVARDLGYELLETTQMQYTLVDLWYRAGTYLDLAGTVVTDGSQPRGLAPGFNFAQFRAFSRDGGKLQEIYTVGVADPMPKAFGLNAWLVQTFAVPLLNLITAEEHRGIPMKSPADLTEVDRRHLDRVGAASVIIGAKPLELRWSLQEEIERAGDESP